MLLGSCGSSTSTSSALFALRSPVILQGLLGKYHGRATASSRLERDREERRRLMQNKKDCVTLGLPEYCNDESQVRDAYIKLCRIYHPDSGHENADSEMFQKVDVAYKNLLKTFAHFRHNRHKVEGEYGLYYQEKTEEEQEEEEHPDIKHTAPQHRQYLSFDGVGSGTPFDREKQYNKYRRAKAAEKIVEYRVEKLSRTGSAEETALAKDTKASKKIKTGIGVDRLVEDLIQESMAKGDFDNLPGKGKPLKHSTAYNPYVDFTTHKLNEVLIENGFAPEWIVLEKEIREELRRIRRELSCVRHRYGLALSSAEEAEWNVLAQDFKEDCDKVNKMVFKFNLTVPSLHKQIVGIQLEKERKKAVSFFSPELHEKVKSGDYAKGKPSRTNYQETSKHINNSSSRKANDDSFLSMLFSIFKS